MIGSSASFVIGRYMLAARMERLAATNWRLRRVKRLLAERPWPVAFLVRLANIPIGEQQPHLSQPASLP